MRPRNRDEGTDIKSLGRLFPGGMPPLRPLALYRPSVPSVPTERSKASERTDRAYLVIIYVFIYFVLFFLRYVQKRGAKRNTCPFLRYT